MHHPFRWSLPRSPHNAWNPLKEPLLVAAFPLMSASSEPSSWLQSCLTPHAFCSPTGRLVLSLPTLPSTTDAPKKCFVSTARLSSLHVERAGASKCYRSVYYRLEPPPVLSRPGPGGSPYGSAHLAAAPRAHVERCGPGRGRRPREGGRSAAPFPTAPRSRSAPVSNYSKTTPSQHPDLHTNSSSACIYVTSQGACQGEAVIQSAEALKGCLQSD